MTTITVTSNTGTAFEITRTDTDLTASAKGFDLGPIDIIEGGIEARFPQKIGGRSVRVAAQLPAGDLAKIKAIRDDIDAAIERSIAADRAYNAEHARTLSAMNSDA